MERGEHLDRPGDAGPVSRSLNGWLAHVEDSTEPVACPGGDQILAETVDGHDVSKVFSQNFRGSGALDVVHPDGPVGGPGH